MISSLVKGASMGNTIVYMIKIKELSPMNTDVPWVRRCTSILEMLQCEQNGMS